MRLDMVSTFEGWAVVTRPIWALRRSGVRVRGLDWLDQFEQGSPNELDRLVRDWETRSYDTTARRRMDALAGEATVRYARNAQRRQPDVKGWRHVAASAAHRTPGIDTLLLESALAEPDADVASLYGGIVAARARLPSWCPSRSNRQGTWSWPWRGGATRPPKRDVGSPLPSQGPSTMS